ncbi:MAG: type II toxin-antitoxin system RelB/DinJ family antitoxin [Aquificota bacterium]|nr:type II toxin-antitoxin system RelB/DinJ family antitoxin [Aquificota bacterium]
MKTSKTTIYVDKEIKKIAEYILKRNYGLSLSQACRLFLNRVVAEGKLPFEPVTRDEALKKFKSRILP